MACTVDARGRFGRNSLSAYWYTAVISCGRSSRARALVGNRAERRQRLRYRHDEDRLRLHARAVPPHRPARLGASRPRGPASMPASRSASTSTHGPRSRARPPSRGRSWGRWGSARTLPFGTAVTCPGFRYHPAVIAHAAATLGAMYPGRFWLGLGAGEALNEHVIGGEWPEVGDPQRDDVRVDRDHHQALQRQGRQARRRVLHARVGAPLHASPSSRCRSTSPPPAR